MQLVCDVKEFLTCANHLLAERKIRAGEEWIAYCDKAYCLLKDVDRAKPDSEGRIPEKYFWEVFREKLPDNTSLALGNSNGVVGMLQLGVKESGQRVIINYNAGSMGDDIPEAVGVAKATQKTVYCVTGDGSAMMNLQELETIRYNKLPVKLVVFSNDGYGAIRQTCKNYFSGRLSGCSGDSGIGFPQFEDVAQTFGMKYFHCQNCAELDAEIEKFIAFEGVALLEIDQLLDDPTLPKMASKLKEDGTFETPSLLDMYPYLDDETLEKLKLS
jgi:acetolactate synthase-1/2/3 large subunit